MSYLRWRVRLGMRGSKSWRTRRCREHLQADQTRYTAEEQTTPPSSSHSSKIKTNTASTHTPHQLAPILAPHMGTYEGLLARLHRIPRKIPTRNRPRQISSRVPNLLLHILRRLLRRLRRRSSRDRARDSSGLLFLVLLLLLECGGEAEDGDPAGWDEGRYAAAAAG